MAHSIRFSLALTLLLGCAPASLAQAVQAQPSPAGTSGQSTPAQPITVQNSPAAQLFQRVGRLFVSDYYGWTPTDRRALLNKYAAELKQRCAPDGPTCSYDTGRAVLEDMFDEFHDDHTSVRDAQSAQRLNEIQNDLTVPRTGARVVKLPQGLLVVGVQTGSPAAQVGLKVNDLITSVNGLTAGKDQAVDSAVFVQLERARTPLKLVLQRPGVLALSLSVTPTDLKARDEITLSYPKPGVALINLPTFLSGDSAQGFLQKVNAAKAAGASELIIDLRYNGGGRLDQCVAAASIFGSVVYQARFRGGSQSYGGVDGEQALAFNARFDRQRHIWTGRAAILVGENTASCAEVFTFFAQKSGVKAVGSLTKGVGNSGVNFYGTPDQGLFSLTMLRAYDEKGNPLPAQITPDVLAPTDITALVQGGQDTTLDAALQLLSAPAAAVAK